MSDNIKVAVRLRPSTQKECYWVANSQSIYRTDENGAQIGESYNFDHIFTKQTNQQLYETVVKPLILFTIDGFNATVFAYGQTSTGKTYTMFGSQQVPGIMHLAVRDLFENIKKHPDLVFNLRASYLEIYNEKINDLLDPNNDNIRIRYDYLGNQILPIKEVAVSNEEEVFDVINEGGKNRKIGETEMNERSSRSHTIFRIIIESTRPEGILQISILNLVDLAGSERLAQTKSEGTRLKEGVNINKSLLTLGLVIKQLSENKDFVNFRDSKLTRLLQPSLGGNANTLIIATVASSFVEETSSTLSFAQRAKTIKNRPEVKEIIPDDYCVQIRICEQRIKMLQEENEQMQKIMLQSKDKLKSLDPVSRRSFVPTSVSSSQRRRHTIGIPSGILEEVVNDEGDDGTFMDADLYFGSMTPSSRCLSPILEESPLKALKTRQQGQKVRQLEERIEMLEEKLRDEVELNRKTNKELVELRELNAACDTKILELNDELSEKEQLLKNSECILEEKEVIMRVKMLENQEKLSEVGRFNEKLQEELEERKTKEISELVELKNEILSMKKLIEEFEEEKEKREKCELVKIKEEIVSMRKLVEDEKEKNKKCELNALKEELIETKRLIKEYEEEKVLKNEELNRIHRELHENQAKIEQENIKSTQMFVENKNLLLKCNEYEMKISQLTNEKESIKFETSEKCECFELKNEIINLKNFVESSEGDKLEKCELFAIKDEIIKLRQLMKEYEDEKVLKNEELNRINRELHENQAKIEEENVNKSTQMLILENKNLALKCNEYEMKINQITNEKESIKIEPREKCECFELKKEIIDLKNFVESSEGDKLEKCEFVALKDEIIKLRQLVKEYEEEKIVKNEELNRMNRDLRENQAKFNEENLLSTQELVFETKNVLSKCYETDLKMLQFLDRNKMAQSVKMENKEKCDCKDEIINLRTLLEEYEEDKVLKNEELNRINRELRENQIKIGEENMKKSQELVLETRNLVSKCNESELKMIQLLNEINTMQTMKIDKKENCELLIALRDEIINMRKLMQQYADDKVLKNEDLNRINCELRENQVKIEQENIKSTETLITENKNLRSKCKEYELKLSQLLNENKEMKILQTEILTLRNECNNRAQSANRMQTDSSTLKGNNQELEFTLKRTMAELDEKKDIIVNLQEELKQTKNELNVMKKLVQKVENENVRAFETIESMKRVYSEENKKNISSSQHLKSENQSLLQKCKDYELKMIHLAKENREIEPLKTELANLKRECSNKDLSIDRLENDIKNLKYELKEKSFTMQPSSGNSKTMKIFTSRELLRKPFIPPPVHTESDDNSTDCDSKLNIELQLKIHELQKKEGTLMDENKILREGKDQLQAKLAVIRNELDALKSKYTETKKMCHKRHTQIEKLMEQLAAKK